MVEHSYTVVDNNDTQTPTSAIELQQTPVSNIKHIQIDTVNNSITQQHNNDNNLSSIQQPRNNTATGHWFTDLHFKRNGLEIAQLAWPVVVSYILQFSLQTVNVIFLGHLNSNYLAASALGNMFCNVTGYSLIYGLATSVDTLCAQAYGSKQYYHMTRVALRAAIMLLLCTLPVYVIWFNAEHILLYAKQDPDVADLAAQFIRRATLGMPPMVCYEVLKKWCQAQRIVKLFLIIGIAANIFNIGMCYTLIYGLKLGFHGAPYATALANWFMLLFGIYLIRYKQYHKLSWPNTLHINELLTGWKQIFVLGIPGMFMICMEWWAFEIMSLCAGWIGTLQLDEFIVCLNIISIGYTVPLGIGIAASTIVGNLLGANTPGDARSASICSVIIGGSIATINAVVMMIMRYRLGSVFSNDSSVISGVSILIPYFALDHWIEGVQGVASGVLRGAGKQSLGAKANLIGYWGVCLPLALLLAFHGWEVMGLIIGLASGVATTLLIYAIALARLDWYDEANKAQIRLIQEKAMYNDNDNDSYNNNISNNHNINTSVMSSHIHNDDDAIDIELARIRGEITPSPKHINNDTLNVSNNGLMLRSPYTGGIAIPRKQSLSIQKDEKFTL